MTEKQLVVYDITEAAISKMESEFMPLVVAGLEDKEGLAIVHDARMIVKNHRVAVEKKRKEFKADALAYGKLVDTEAKRITSLLEPIESHLQAEEDTVKIELERIAAEEAEKERIKIQDRADGLLEFNVVKPYFEVATMTDEEFDNFLHNSEYEFNAKKEADAKEAEARRAENERLKIERETQDAIAKELLEAQAKLDADRKALEDEKKAEIDRKVAEKAKIDAAEKAIADAKAKAEADAKAEEERLDRENKEMQEKAEAKRLAKIREDSLRPDKEKLLEFVDRLDVMFNASVEIDLDVEASQSLLEEIISDILNHKDYFIDKINAL